MLIWFKDTRKEDIAKVGGKAANLGELVNAGIPVPPGFTISADVYKTFIDTTGLRPVITKLLDGLDSDDSAKLDTTSAKIQAAIMKKKLPPELVKAIKRAYRELSGASDKYVAIRSSATAEDLPDASFAGQQSTYLNVLGADNVVKAVQACWASLMEARAIFYRSKHDFDHMDVNLAVVVQRMVQSEKAGVMFTVNPVTGDPDQLEIAAVYGLGEAAVSGIVTPDTYICSKTDHKIVERTVVPQPTMLVKRRGHQTGHADANTWKRLSPKQAAAPKLTNRQIKELAAIGQQVEAHYGYAQDIEWAFEKGRFYLTQARPVTVKSTDYVNEKPLPPEPAEVLVIGQPASPGVGTGRVRILKGPHECHLVKAGDVLVTGITTPDYVPAMQRAAAIVTERGGRTCHAAIVSRELGVPAVVGAEHAIKKLRKVTTVTVDGGRGEVFKGKAETRIALDKQRQAELADRQQKTANLKTKTKVMVILAEPDKAEAIASRHVDGVGLLRAEFILARIGQHPRKFIKDKQSEVYIKQLAAGIIKFCEAFGPRPVVYRLLDFKTNELANLKGGAEFERPEENPMLGFRGAVRYARDPEVFALEIEAIKRVRAKHKNLYVMVPFVRTPLELRGVIQLMAKHGLKRGPDFKLWVMAELPSNVLILDKFIDEGIDGISIGSNDLTQLILGMDRDNELLDGIGDERDEAVMKAIETIIETALRRKVTVSICGQAPSDFPEITRKLVGWGITSISVSPDMLERTRQIVKTCEDETVKVRVLE
jgi:pyruvate,water dikinase